MTTRRLSRRQFIVGATGVGATGAAAIALGRSPIERALGLTDTRDRTATASHKPTLSHSGGTLVLITLYGGNDGLNTVIPYADSAYQAARPALGYQPAEVLGLDAQFGLHPNLTGLKELWDAHELAIVLGVGYPNPNRSHFRSMDIWQSAVPDREEVTGWLGRWLDSGPTDPLRALSAGPTLPRLLQGAKVAAGAVPSGTLKLPGGTRLGAAFAALEHASPGDTTLRARVAQSGADLLTILQTVGGILDKQPPTAIGGQTQTPGSTTGAGNLEPSGTAGAGPPTTRPPRGPGATTRTGASPAKPGASGELAAQLDLVARLIKGGAPTRVYSVSLGGFDTHATEKDNHARLMAELDAGVAGFLKTFDGDARGDRIVVMSYSEFGRRVSANASGGTDHGTAAPLFVTGRAVKGGYYGEQPSLTDLDQGDLKFSTDFRSVYATVLDRVLGVDPASVLAGYRSPNLAFL